MKKNGFGTCWTILAVFLLMQGCTADKAAVIETPLPATAPRVSQPIKTLAIFPFENNAVTDHDSYAPLSKGLSAMLISDLKRRGTSLKIIERNKIRALLEEITLGESGYVEQGTAVRMGRILGAQSIAFGSFSVLGTSVRMDTRIVNVETSEIILTESIVGKSDGFFQLEHDLAAKMAHALKSGFQTDIGKVKGGIQAALYYSQGLEALDQGEITKARTLFKKCLETDPAYTAQVSDVMAMN